MTKRDYRIGDEDVTYSEWLEHHYGGQRREEERASAERNERLDYELANWQRYQDREINKHYAEMKAKYERQVPVAGVVEFSPWAHLFIRDATGFSDSIPQGHKAVMLCPKCLEAYKKQDPVFRRDYDRRNYGQENFRSNHHGKCGYVFTGTIERFVYHRQVWALVVDSDTGEKFLSSQVKVNGNWWDADSSALWQWPVPKTESR